MPTLGVALKVIAALIARLTFPMDYDKEDKEYATQEYIRRAVRTLLFMLGLRQPCLTNYNIDGQRRDKNIQFRS